MKKVIRLTESDLIRIVKRVIKEESESYTLDDYLLVLGYLHQHGDQMFKDSGKDIYFLQSKKNVMHYCEDKIDGKKVYPLTSSMDKQLFNITLEEVKKSQNKKDYIKLAKD